LKSCSRFRVQNAPVGAGPATAFFSRKEVTRDNCDCTA
jgi:hypothetical protein